jgi:penicillin-binding protein 1A
MMEGVVQRGTGTAVKAVGKPLAGKTGTTNDFHDAWFEGFSPDLAAGVYIGYDDPDSLGKDETGGHVSAPVFRDFMIAALKDKPATDFRIPPGLRLYRVSAATGLPVSGSEPAIYEAYKPGTEPGKTPDVAKRDEPAAEDGETPVATDAPADDAAMPSMPPPATAARGAPASGTGGLY